MREAADGVIELSLWIGCGFPFGVTAEWSLYLFSIINGKILVVEKAEGILFASEVLILTVRVERRVQERVKGKGKQRQRIRALILPAHVFVLSCTTFKGSNFEVGQISHLCHQRNF